jgi:hypothetical protein
MRKLLLVLFLATYSGMLQAAAGHFLFVTGNVKVVSKTGQAHAAARGGEVDVGDTISTGSASTAQLKMVDGGFLAVRPQSELRVDSYSFHGNKSDNSTVSLVKGGFRAITGMIGKNNPQNDIAKTPTATIGIRGTLYEAVYVTLPAAGKGGNDEKN